jgi:hypothetical protein
MYSYSGLLRGLSAKVKKGQVRATVLNQIKELEKGIEKLTEGKEIKKSEVKDYGREDHKKVSTLKKQIEIIEDGIGHMKQALSALKPYKKYTTS